MADPGREALPAIFLSLDTCKEKCGRRQMEEEGRKGWKQYVIFCTRLNAERLKWHTKIIIIVELSHIRTVDI